MSAPKVVAGGRVGAEMTDAKRDRMWGPGQWVRCENCPKYDGVVYHHRDYHSGITRRYPS